MEARASEVGRVSGCFGLRAIWGAFGPMELGTLELSGYS